MPQRNCHARSKQKRKRLRMSNLLKKIHARKLERLRPEPTKGRPYKGKALDIAIPYHELFPDDYGSLYFPRTNHGRNLNQRQKRKAVRQQPHGR